MKHKTGIELVRYAARLFDYCNETFNQQYSAEELLKIADACQKSEYDFLPDTWEDRQIKEAIAGKVPRWREVVRKLDSYEAVYDD